MIEIQKTARRAWESLPSELRQRPLVERLASTLAEEVLHYSDGIVPFTTERTEDGVLRMICEDIESAALLADFLATELDEEEELDPEELRRRIMARAEEIAGSLSAGETLQKLIRGELADTDCGACDHPTCDEYSVALADGSDDDNTKCEPGGPKVTAQVELVMDVGKGQSVEPEKILSIAAQAKEAPGRDGGPRIVELSNGRGLPAVVLSAIYPDAQFHVIEPDTRRAWFLKRMINLLGVRNCRVHVGAPELYYDELGGSFDLVLVKHRAPRLAVEEGVAFARPGGQVVVWQGRDWSDAAADYQHHGPGMQLPLQAPRYFTAKPVERQVLLLIRRPDAAASEEDAVAVTTAAEAEPLATP